MEDIDPKSRIEDALLTHGPELRRFVAARVHDSDVDDILQIAAMRAVEKADSLQDSQRILPWLYRIHRNAAIDFGRKLASEQRKLDALAAEPVSVEAEDHAHCRCSIAQARQLNTRYATILDLVDIGGASLKEAARILDVTVNTATVRLHRARIALKQSLLEHCGVKNMRESVDCKCSSASCCST
ncbi:MAG: sigma-70 family RNA polymerase sigma factor [Pseudomonadota bacterium]